MNTQRMTDLEKILWRWSLGLLALGFVFLVREHWEISKWMASTNGNRYTVQDAKSDWDRREAQYDELTRRLHSLELRLEQCEKED